MMQKNEDVKWGAGLFVPEDKIIFEQEVGSGKYGRVFKAHVYARSDLVVHRHPCEIYGTEVAVKVPKDEPANQSKILQLFRGEAQHENVCRWLGYSTKIDENGKEQLLLITEFLPGGNLQEVIEGIGSGRRPLSLFSRLRMARDIARGMIFVHENSLVHRDLKPDNLMLDEFGRVKIVDFGFAQLVPKQLTKGTRLGSFLWMAPEVMLRKPFNHQSDVYSFAVIFWSLVTGKDPYTDYQEQSPFIEDVGEKGHRPPLPDIVPSVQCLVKDCWDPEPAKRPTFLQVNERLNSVLIEVSCSDEYARAYWSKYHFSYDKVQWSVFCKTFSRFTSLQPPDDMPHPSLSTAALPQYPSSAQLRLATVAVLRDFMQRSPEANKLAFEEFRRRDLMEKWTGLKSVLMEGDPYTRVEIVHLERFGKVTSLFGPFHNPEAFFENIRSILRQRWFFGILSKDQAADSLRARPGLQTKPGTFLVRMSTNPLHDGVISLHTGKQIMHIEIQHVRNKGFHLLGKDQHFPGLKELVEHYIFQGLLKDPAPFAHPFRQFQDPADDSAPEIGYLLPKDFLIGEDAVDQGIRDRLKNTPPMPNVERRQLGFSQDLISSPELSELITTARVVPSSEEQANEFRKRLKLRLELYGFREKPIAPGPNSLFEAISDQLYGNLTHSQRLRGEAVYWLKMNPNLAWSNGASVRQQVSHFEQYVQEMEKLSCPGDLFVLQVLATMNRVRIWVISSVPALQYVTEILPHPNVKVYQEKALVLSHHHSNGFGSLQPLDEMEVDQNSQPDAAYREFITARAQVNATQPLDALQRTMAVFERVTKTLRYAELEAEKSADKKSHGLLLVEWRQRIGEVTLARTDLEKLMAFKLVGQ